MGREEPSHDSADKNINAVGRNPMAFFLGLNKLQRKGE
jgi:hypothetical protein